MNLFDLLKWLASPVVRIALAFLGPLGIILGAIIHPQGAVNGFVCRVIDLVAYAWPSTPPHLKLASLLSGAFAPDDIGGYVVYEMFTTGAIMLSIVLLIKLYKLIPFKMT